MADLPSTRLKHYLPILDWLPNYRRRDLPGDVIAGAVVAVMLIPQSMAYALLAGLPPQTGLYASLLPLLLYALLGTSRVLSVGPVAMVSLLVATGIHQLQPQGTAATIQLALTLALLVGLIQLALGLFRIGFITNFLSFPVLSGFVSAAAIIIATSQLKHLLGILPPLSEHFYESILYLLQHIPQFNPITVIIAAASIGVLLYFKQGLEPHLRSRGVPERLIMPVTQSSPLVVVTLGTLIVWALRLDVSAGVAIVGDVPAGLPPLSLPTVDLAQWGDLLPIAVAISLVGFMESISIAKSLASKRREKVDSDQELIALGAASIGAAFTGGYPVAGSLSRTGINAIAGAKTGLASVITAGVIVLALTTLTPLFYFLPNAVLAAIIIVAVTNLFDVATFKRAWRYNRVDALSLAITFGAVLLVSIESGILIGAGASLLLYLWRTSRPQITINPVYSYDEHPSDHGDDQILTVRIDENLYFLNAQHLEDVLLNAAQSKTQLSHLVLACGGVHYIDISALETLNALRRELRDLGVTLHLAEVHEPVRLRLEHIGFTRELAPGEIFPTLHEALTTLERRARPELAMAQME
jgi:SulP family sulfate permease